MENSNSERLKELESENADLKRRLNDQVVYNSIFLELEDLTLANILGRDNEKAGELTDIECDQEL
jgi:hypothetical protein